MKDTRAGSLAKLAVEARAELRKACRVLHDDVGSLLAVAGLRLQLLRLDHPEVAARSAEIGEALEGVMDLVRNLSRELDPSPAGRVGLKSSLITLAGKQDGDLAGRVSVSYNATVTIPAGIADAFYDAASRALAVAVTRKGVSRVAICVSGSKTLTVKVRDNGTQTRVGAELELAALLAQQAGLRFEVATGKGTIVSIQYAVRRPAGR